MTEINRELFKKIPGVDNLLGLPQLEEALVSYPRSLVLRAVHQVIDELRSRITAGSLRNESELALNLISDRIVERLVALARPSLRPVINATGVVIHTNLGRSILPKAAIQEFESLSGGYSNLEYDLEQGKRGSRYVHVEEILKELTSAEAAMVVNNNAAAVLVALDTLARGREVIVSRGELVEIGGSFRIPDVMRKSGAKMIEVGTTNKTHVKDYEEVITPETGLLLKVHQSNFRIMGFTEEVGTDKLVELGRRNNIPVMEDLGSGCFIDFSKFGYIKEPTVQETLGQGVDLVTFSGDKLMGGPQAGIILGRSNIIEAVRKNQLSRALRIDKLTLLALEQTLTLYRDEKRAIQEVPTLNMIFQPYEMTRKRVQQLKRMIGKIDTRNFELDYIDGSSRVGGGAMPLLEIPSRILCLIPTGVSASRLEKYLRGYDPPIIVRLERDRILIDARTVQDHELKLLGQAIRWVSGI
jgi:L-seryl-tRNA(Ser) seleniumtransferase